MSASKASERVLKMQRNLSLRLYKSIMRSHRALPSGMRDVGDVYVREEFKLHKTAKPEHLGPFFEQWINCTYDSHTTAHTREPFLNTSVSHLISLLLALSFPPGAQT
jgi:hypothetical protein